MANILLIGSGNVKKAAELTDLLDGLPWEVHTLRDYPAIAEPEETGSSFEENAIAKATYYGKAFNLACVGDDSGLVVDALNGEPGIYSARYAGPMATDKDNNEKLLTRLEPYLWHERTARFICFLAFYRPCHPVHIESGVVEGHISTEAFGGNGFGYDPLFVPSGHDRTFGELDVAIKHSLSHRGTALRKFCSYLETLV
jgi:XTP/dITP diphosphohydrolase